MIAEPDLPEAVKDATLLIFVLPHQFLGRICPQMTTMAKGCRAISLIKGIEFEEAGPILISNMIKEAMGGARSPTTLTLTAAWWRRRDSGEAKALWTARGMHWWHALGAAGRQRHA